MALEAVSDALKEAEANVERHAIAKLESLLPDLVGDYMKLAKNSVSDGNANQIAAFAGNNDDDNGN